MSNTFDFLRAQFNHRFMVDRIVAHATRDVLLLQSSDAMFETRRAWNRPGAGKGGFVPHIGKESLWVRSKSRGNVRELVEIRYQPRFGADPEVSVRQEDHGGHVLQGNSRGLEH